MSTLLAILLFTFPVAGAAGTSWGWLPAVGGPPAAPVLATSDTQIGLWIAGGAGALGAVAVILAFIRREARMQEPTPSRNLIGGPVTVQAAKDCVERHEHDDLCQRVERIEQEMIASERRQNARLDEHFRTLNAARSASIAGLHGKMESTGSEVRREIDSKVGETHDRINGLAEKLGELIGEVRAMRTTGGRPR